MVVPTLLPPSGHATQGGLGGLAKGGEGAPQMRKGDEVIPPTRHGRTVGRHAAAAVDAADVVEESLQRAPSPLSPGAGDAAEISSRKSRKHSDLMKIEPRIRSMYNIVYR